MADVRGIVIRDEGDTLVLRPTAQEVSRFSGGDAVSVRRLVRGASPWQATTAEPGRVRTVPVRDILAAIQSLRHDEWVYNAAGQPVGRVRETTVQSADGFGNLAGVFRDAQTGRGWFQVKVAFDTRRFRDPMEDVVPFVDELPVVAP